MDSLYRLKNMTRRLSAELESQAWEVFCSLLPDAENTFGTRDRSFEVVDIVQSDDGPNMKLDGQRITLIVGPNVQAYPPTLVSNIAHETVHTLNPTVGNASWLEEGAAVYFELNTIERKFDRSERQKFIDHLPDTYKNALADYERLLEIDSDAGKNIRMLAGLSSVSSAQLRRLFPTVRNVVIKRLVDRKQMR